MQNQGLPVVVTEDEPSYWSEWKEIRPCSVSCGGGYKDFRRHCNHTELICDGQSHKRIGNSLQKPVILFNNGFSM